MELNQWKISKKPLSVVESPSVQPIDFCMKWTQTFWVRVRIEQRETTSAKQRWRSKGSSERASRSNPLVDAWKNKLAVAGIRGLREFWAGSVTLRPIPWDSGLMHSRSIHRRHVEFDEPRNWLQCRRRDFNGRYCQRFSSHVRLHTWTEREKREVLKLSQKWTIINHPRTNKRLFNSLG